MVLPQTLELDNFLKGFRCTDQTSPFFLYNRKSNLLDVYGINREETPRCLTVNGSYESFFVRPIKLEDRSVTLKRSHRPTHLMLLPTFSETFVLLIFQVFKILRVVNMKSYSLIILNLLGLFLRLLIFFDTLRRFPYEALSKNQNL